MTNTSLPYQMTERELVARYLRARSDFWQKFLAHRNVARALANEAHLIEMGHQQKMCPVSSSRAKGSET